MIAWKDVAVTVGVFLLGLTFALALDLIG